MPKVQIPKVETKREIHHEQYETIKACLESNIPVYLAGPAGSGKNHTVEQIAKELGWDFYFSNSVQQEYKLTGFIDAGGKFHETEFYKACTDDNDCVLSIGYQSDHDIYVNMDKRRVSLTLLDPSKS